MMNSPPCKQVDVMSNSQKFEIIRRATNLYHDIVTQQGRGLLYHPIYPPNSIWNPKIIHPTTISGFPSILDTEQANFRRAESITDTDSGLPSSDGSGKSLFISNAISHECPLCGKKHNSSSALKMHQRTHNPPCICPQCGKAFSRMWLLSGHLRIHTGERPYVCSRCQRAFADRSNLRAHMQTHTTRKRYQCDRCPRSFSRQSLLRKHSSQCCTKPVDVN